MFEKQLKKFTKFLERKRIEYQIEKSLIHWSVSLTIYGLKCRKLKIWFSDCKNSNPNYTYDYQFINDFNNSEYWQKAFRVLKKIVERNIIERVYWFRYNQSIYENQVTMGCPEEEIYIEVLRRTLIFFKCVQNDYYKRAVSEALRIAKTRTGKNIQIDLKKAKIIVK